MKIEWNAWFKVKESKIILQGASRMKIQLAIIYSERKKERKIRARVDINWKIEPSTKF